MSKRIAVPSLLPLVLATGAIAQSTLVSPVAFAAKDGNSSLSYMFTSGVSHTQQVHGDIRGTPRILTALSFRRDGVSTATTGASRSIDLELLVGDADYQNVGANFAANYVGAPKTVVARKIVATPSWQTPPATPPAPFDFTLAFDTPFVWLGTLDVAWELRAYSNTGASTDTFRTDLATPAFTNSPSPSFGTPCTSTGFTQSYQLLGTMGTNVNPEFRWTVQGFPTPPNCALNVLLVGATNPNASITGLCVNLYSSGELSLPMPASDANGTWTLPQTYFPFNPSWVGVSFFEQAFSYDAGKTGLQVVGTAGRQLTFQAVPASGDAAKVKRVSDFTSPTSTVAQSISDGGFVVQFTY